MHDRRSGRPHLAGVIAVAVTACIASLIAGCSREPQDPGANTSVDIRPKRADAAVTNPTTLRVTLRFADDTVEVVAVEPTRDNDSHDHVAREVGEALAGRTRLLRYRVLDANGAVLAASLVSTPRVAIAKHPDPAENQRIVRRDETLPSVSTTVSLPYNPGMRVLELAELQPQPGTPPHTWPALPAQRLELPGEVAP
jgi:hypothetical protein